MMNRRQFLSHSCALGAAVPTLGTSLLSLGVARTAAAQAVPNDYKALVCILLAGGNDSYNMLVPTDNSQYAQYAAIRSDLALPAGELLPLSVAAADNASFGLHPGMGALQGLINNGDASLIANVGTLLEAFDPLAVENGTARLPVGLFSHSDQIAQWQTAVPDGRVSEGWAGRIADRMQSANMANGIAMNLSLSGTNTFQSGAQTVEYSISSQGDGATGLNAYADGSEGSDYRTGVIDQLLSVEQQQILRREYRGRLRGALDNQQTFATAMADAAELATPFSMNPLSGALRQIARVISVQNLLGAQRQTFFVTVGGWDHHDEVLQNQAAMLPMVANALAEFRSALIELDAWNDVTTFTISDFGRTMTSNGRGSDHGWGGHHVVMGGSVQGGQVFGRYPTLAANAPLDVGRGVYAPTTSVDLYFADLALWFGVPITDLDQVLPNVRSFYSPESGVPALGLFGSSNG